jgi:tetratricopeptide (TPR) repeat protein
MNSGPPVESETATLLRAALVHHAEQRPDQAEALYRQVLEQDPDQVQALGMLALLASDRDDKTEAEALMLRHLALKPADGSSLLGLGRIKAQRGEDAAAIDYLRRAADALPHLAPAHNDLGACLHRLGRREEALAALDHAVELDPGYAVAHANRGLALHNSHRYDEATDALRLALDLTPADQAERRAALLEHLCQSARKAGRSALTQTLLRAELQARPDHPPLMAQLAQSLEQAGQAREALALRNRLARGAGLHRGGRTDKAAAQVLVLGAVGGGHTPTRYLLDPEIFATLTLTLLSPDQPDAPLGEVSLDALMQADLVFSTLGDIDHDGGQFAAAEDLCRRLGKPVINPPAAIAKTGRDQAATLFAGMDGMITPKVRRITTDALTGLSIAAPQLVRPPGDHGGDNLTLLRDDADKAAYLRAHGDGPLLLTPFHDYRSTDGHWRKYRLIFIGGEVFPYHLAIGDDWLVHYWRAEMSRAPWKMAEEERFFADWRGVFGARAADAAQEAARRLGLDYAGMDCSLTVDGQLLLFEANACILLHLDEPAAVFGYKHRYTPPIRDAFSRLLLRRAGRAAY